jgi:hypothetical protein
VNAAQRLDELIAHWQQRLRWRAGARTAFALAAALLAVTLLSAAVLLYAGVPWPWRVIARCVLLLLAVGLVWRFAWQPLRALHRDEGAQELERSLPLQQGRLLTYLDQRRRVAQGESSPLLGLLAADALARTDQAPLDQQRLERAAWLPSAASVAVLVLFAGLLAWRGSDWGAAARSLWWGAPAPQRVLPLAQRRIDIKPGDSRVRRNNDLQVQASPVGFAATEAQLHVQFGEGDWETVPMRVAEGQLDYTLYAVREAARYYVTAGDVRSAEHSIQVVDLPQIDALRLTYTYPSWTGLPPRVQEVGGDISAVAGTRVRIELRTDVPLQQPQLVIDEQAQAMTQQGVTGRGELVVGERTTRYRLAATVEGESVALSDSYRIDVVPDEKPTVEIRRPGRDYQASSIEEVPVSVRARDDFKLEGLELRYAVNGGEWRTQTLDPRGGDASNLVLLRLEELRQSPALALEPGDVISYYAVARDHHSTVQTDLFLIQVQPFDRRYTQSQAAGGGGGGGGGGEQEGRISDRQREILMATFNLARAVDNGTQDSGRVQDSATLLSDLQKTLAEQAQSLVERAGARELVGGDDNVTRFVTQLTEAAKAMKPAAENLSKRQLQQAVSDEQRALQHLLRAEATFRDIQVAQQSGARGGGGGGGGQASRDVAEMTALEMDLEKNQYETESQSPGSPAASAAEDDAVRRLRELARRQEQLAREQAQRTQPPEAQRWQQEQLRREAEALRQQLQQLAQQQSGQQSGQQQQGGQQQGGQQQGGQQQGGQQQGGQQQRGAQQQSANAARDAAAQLDQAIRAMREGRAGAEQQLNQALDRLDRGRQQAAGERYSSLARDADAVLREQQRSEEALREAMKGNRSLRYDDANRLAERKRALQSQLEALQGQMQAARQKGKAQTPRAAAKVEEALRQLEEQSTLARIARSAQEIDRGRGESALAREPLIGEALQGLQQQLAEAGQLAATEAGEGSQGAGSAKPDELLAELGQLRRALQQAGGQQGGQQAGQSGNQQAGGQQAGGQQSGQQAGGRQGGGQQGGQRDGGGIDRGRGWNGGDGARIAGRLRELGERLPGEALSEADRDALRELAQRIARGGRDPMAGEYSRMTALLNQVELAALRAAKATQPAGTRAVPRGAQAADRADDVAEYYRRLGTH